MGIGTKGDFKETIFSEVNENLKALERLFPSVVKDGHVDFEALKEALGEFEEVGPEKYELTWSGKKNAKKVSQQDIVAKTLKYIPEDSVNPETTENLYIEGDNLEVLKLLRQNYYGAIKMIYIDPPYNTGNDFVYNDSFFMNREESELLEGDISELGERYTINAKSSNKYHANWLNMMYPRLKLAKELLKDDGVIFISIDDGEVDNLRKICNEIFGEANFVADLTVVNNLKGRNDKKYIARANERLLMYIKSDEFIEHGLALDDKVVKEYSLEDGKGKYRLLELRKRGGADTRIERPNMFYPFFVNTETGEVSLEENYYYNTRAIPMKSNGEEGRWRWGKDTAFKRLSELYGKLVGEKYNIYEKDYLENEEGARRVRPKSVLAGAAYSTDVSTKEYRSIMGKIDFSNPKSVTLLSDLIIYATQPHENEIVLDFFSGSATTAHAVYKSNAEEQGNRKFIMVQIPELTQAESEQHLAGYKNICEIGKERIRRAGKKILEDNKDKEGNNNLDIGFKVFRVDDTNIRWIRENDELRTLASEITSNEDVQQTTFNYIAATSSQVELDEVVSSKDRLDFMPGFKDVDVVYELILRQRDIPLSAKVRQLDDIGGRIYLFDESFLVCLEEDITNELVEKLASINPLPIKFILRDSAFGDDINLKDETNRRLKTLIERNTGETKKTYTVEYI